MGVKATSYVFSPQQAAALRALCKRYLRKAARDETNGDGQTLATNVRDALDELSRGSAEEVDSNQSGAPLGSTSGQR